jgi:hypothetical protein
MARPSASALRRAGIILTVLLAVGGVLTLALVPGAQSDEVTVEATWSGCGGSLDTAALRGLLAWRKGDLRIQRYSFAATGLKVTKVIKGELHDPRFQERPVGVDHLQVIFVNDAAIAWDKFGIPSASKVSGIWTLTELPDGSYVVADAKNTPFKTEHIAEGRKGEAEVARGLNPGDPQRQHDALRKFKRMKCFGLVPAVLPLLDSEAKVVVPDGIRFRDARGACRHGPAASTLGAEARSALVRVTGPLRDRNSPTKDDAAAAWRKWWSELLEAEPFPRVEVEPGKVRTLAAPPMNQTWPEPRLLPGGRYALVGVSRYERPLNGARSGIRLVEIDRPLGDDFVYKVPLDAVNCEPRCLTVARRGNEAGIAWKEYSHKDKQNTVRFMSLGLPKRKGAAVDLRLRRISHISVCTHGDGHWLLACSAVPADVDPTKYSDRDRKDIFLVELDASGNVSRRHPPLELGGPPKWGDHGKVLVFSVASTPKGPALAYANARQGAFLSLLDRDLKIRRTVQMNDPKERAHGFRPRVAVKGETVCVAWAQEDNYDDRLFARTYDLDGNPLSDARVVAEPVVATAGPVAAGDGFAVAWTDSQGGPSRVRLVTIGPRGNVGKTKTVFASRHLLSPIEVGATERAVHVMVLDRVYYPHRLLLKSVALID